MLKFTKSITVNGQSLITVDGADVLVATMNATIPAEDAPTQGITKSNFIQNQELYKANKDTVRKDIDDFNDQVDALAGL